MRWKATFVIVAKVGTGRTAIPFGRRAAASFEAAAFLPGAVQYLFARNLAHFGNIDTVRVEPPFRTLVRMVIA
jgi:hypothetical protein